MLRAPSLKASAALASCRRSLGPKWLPRPRVLLCTAPSPWTTHPQATHALTQSAQTDSTRCPSCRRSAQGLPPSPGRVRQRATSRSSAAAASSPPHAETRLHPCCPPPFPWLCCPALLCVCRAQGLGWRLQGVSQRPRASRSWRTGNEGNLAAGPQTSSMTLGQSPKTSVGGRPNPGSQPIAVCTSPPQRGVAAGGLGLGASVEEEGHLQHHEPTCLQLTRLLCLLSETTSLATPAIWSSPPPPPRLAPPCPAAFSCVRHVSHARFHADRP